MNPEPSKVQIDELLFRYYGLRGSLDRLAGENLNYRVTTPEGERYVLKIVADAAPAEMEYRLLEHARQAGFPLDLPFIVKNYSAEIDTGMKLHSSVPIRARLLSFVDGELLEKRSDISRILLENTGRALAELDRALAGFDHPALHRGHDWELPRAGLHREKLGQVQVPADRELAAWGFERWAGVETELAGLPRQAIHGDANPENILVRGERVVGLVDFGDACFNPRVCDLAICLAYLMMGREDPLAAAAAVTDGYASELPLSTAEREILLPLACGRLAVTVTVASARRAIDPDNPNWFVSLQPALALLRKLHALQA